MHCCLRFCSSIGSESSPDVEGDICALARSTEDCWGCQASWLPVVGCTGAEFGATVDAADAAAGYACILREVRARGGISPTSTIGRCSCPNTCGRCCSSSELERNVCRFCSVICPEGESAADPQRPKMI